MTKLNLRLGDITKDEAYMRGLDDGMATVLRDLAKIKPEVKTALESENTDQEHFVLVTVADLLGIEWVDPNYSPPRVGNGLDRSN